MTPSCLLTIEIEPRQSSGGGLPKPPGKCLLNLFIFIYIVFLPEMFLLPENARKFLGKMQPSGNLKSTNLKKLDSLK